MNCSEMDFTPTAQWMLVADPASGARQVLATDMVSGPEQNGRVKTMTTGDHEWVFLGTCAQQIG